MSATLDRIAKLLNQAENASTEAEAAVFMAKAQQLATINSIDLARARHITKSKEKTVPIQRTIRIGLQGTKGLRTQTDLYLGIARANDIRCTIASNATCIFAYGFAEDIDVSEALYASLVVQMAGFVEAYRQSGEWKKETAWVDDRIVYLDGEGKPCSERYAWDKRWVPGHSKPVTWLTARLNFQDGFANRIGSRLSEAKWNEEFRQIKAEKERARRPHLEEDGVPTVQFNAWFIVHHGLDLNDLDDDTGTTLDLAELLRDVDDDWTQEILAEYQADLKAQENVTGAALVLASKREAVEEFYAPALKKARGSYRGGTSGAEAHGARRAGSSAADRARLGSSTAIGGQRKALGQ